ncbi:Cyclopentanone 1,2-monooxygenase [Fonsecaea pedrosoi]|nr:Cyclopentanone 1,2-monooxygenase [Fonsecaea pedrosoi]
MVVSHDSQSNGTAVNGDAANGAHSGTIDCDVIIVGGGFSGMTALHKARKLGLTAKIFEEGTDFGGVWYWNRYPGARVDSEAPFYQLSIPEVTKDWYYSQRFPDHTELRKYMAHIDKILDLRKDTYFNAQVIGAEFDTKKALWTVKTSAGHVARGKYIVIATGLLHKKYLPEFPGMGDYKGELYHSGAWPENLSVKGKRVGIIGTGATSVQIVQELAKEADTLTNFMRRPSYCVPAGNRPLTIQEQKEQKGLLHALFKAGRHSFVGIPVLGTVPGKSVLDATPEEREEAFEIGWNRGGAGLNSCGYTDILTDKKANRIVYDFWRKKVRARMTDPVKMDLMAPAEPPYWYGTKRQPLEEDYYECIDMPHVEVVDLNAAPLQHFTEKGILTADGKEREFDVIALATGFESYTGSIVNMGLLNKDGIDLKDLWKDGIKSYLGILINGFPNAFMVYSPQAPTSLSNGPTILECQLDYVFAAIEKLEKEHAKSIEPTPEAQDEWKKTVLATTEGSLIPLTNSWWTGANIPGKKAELVTFCHGIENYEKEILKTLDGWKGFDIVHESVVPLE